MRLAPANISLYRRPLRVSCEEARMPQSPATVPLPPCLLCNRTSHHPPGTLGWITTGEPETGWTEKIFAICWACDGDSDQELKQKIAALFAPAAAAAE